MQGVLKSAGFKSVTKAELAAKDKDLARKDEDLARRMLGACPKVF